MQIHPRYWKVTEARNRFALAICDITEKHRPYINSVTDSLLKIALATNLAVKTKKRKEPDLDKVGKAIYEALVVQEKAQELTINESVKILIEAAADNHRYALRHERHPKNPDKKYDEA
jgi:PHD/YefM family antitoxin component YafN of YafNO toxin-antitoxin module